MSIKKLFDSTNKSRNYLSDTNEKDAFQDAESRRNVKAQKEKQDAFVPQVDYSDPENFAKYGSAYLYYKSAVERIHDYYPYDGSDAEITEFYNKSLDIEKYIFNNLYPRTTGYAIMSADGWGSLQGSIKSGYGLSGDQEFITLYGGPNTSSYTTLVNAFDNPYNSKFQSSNIYDTNIYQTEGLPTNYASGSRESNLRADFDDGVTVEFWIKTGSLNSTSLTNKQVIFDMWNNELSSSSDYGRITVTVSGNFSGEDRSPFYLTVQSGTSGIFEQNIGSTALASSTLSDWQHYAIKINNTGSNTLTTKMYVGGALDDTNDATGALSALKTKNMMARIGGLLTAPSGTADSSEDMSGYGKLSGSIDEFRYWKMARSANEIARYWFTQVRGGVNTDINNATLGVYYKFNEGITTTAATDNTVLDYSGRIGNGVWTGYGSNSRNTGSAILSGSAAKVEYEDPIIHSTHTKVVNLKNGLLDSGSFHDLNNNSSFLSLMPAWVIEEDDEKTGNLRKMTHIVGAYFDKLLLQIDALPGFKNTLYTSASYSPVSLAKHLPQSLGMYMPELFIDSDVMERFLSRDQTTLFESDLNESKNLIYLNLYNNLANIYKSKGTEKAVKNVLRCFNLDDRLIKLNVYSDGQTYPLKNNLKQTLVEKTYINFNDTDNQSAVIYQLSESSNSDSFNYLSCSTVAGSSQLDKYGFTAEADIVFPYFDLENNKIKDRPSTVSLFGMHSVDVDNPTHTTWVSSDKANFQVYAIRDTKNSKNTYFKLTSSVSPFPIPVLTSSVFFDTYNNENWNISVRLKPSNYPLSDVVTGSDTYTYDLIFRGINTVIGTVKDSFTLTASVAMSTGKNFLREPKRVYVGARRTNITGALLNNSDVLFSGIKFWTKYLEDDDLNQHIFDIENAGISGSYRSISPFASGSDSSLVGHDLLNLNTLLLNWNFNNVTSSDSGGNFTVSDISSGSALIRDNYGWLGSLAGYQYTGYGYGFAASSTASIDKRLENSYKFIDPEAAVSSNMINILSDDDRVFGLPVSQTIPSYFYAIEKSMHNAISEEMLTFFAGVVDFNDIIGAPVNRYRERYKTIEKLREIFFRKVTTVTEVEKFINYYKWFDDALSEIISQLIPASSGFVPDILNTVESHVLERNKYKSQFPTIEDMSRAPAATPALGIEEKEYNWKFGHHPISDKESENCPWWHKRADPESNSVISSGDTIVDKQRSIIKDSIANMNDQTSSYVVTTDKTPYKHDTSRYMLRLSRPYKLRVDSPIFPLPCSPAMPLELHGGVNFTDNKNIHFTYNALYPGGGYTSSADSEVMPDNLLLYLSDALVPIQDCVDCPWPQPPELKKTKRVFKVWHGRDFQGGTGYTTVKSSYAFPFNIISASVNTVDEGYSQLIINNITAGIDVVNLHNDVYGPDMEVPIQGPYTDHVVGGHQSRHIAVNTGSAAGSDTCLTRPEAWKILLDTVEGSTPDVTGAFGMVGADYPWYPSASSYPNPHAPKAVYYRDVTTKRPVNIRNILITTQSTIGNYDRNWQVVNTVGAFENPKHFVNKQPSLPSQITETPSASQGRLFTDIHRTEGGHTEFIPSYSIGYLTGTASNSVIIGRFGAPGGIETMGIGYGDIRSAEYSVYNCLSYRNLTVIKPSQGPTGSISEPTGAGTPGIRVSDIHGNDFGLRAHLARHSGRFGRDPFLVASPGSADTASTESPNMHKVNRNPLARLKITNAGDIFNAPTITVASSSLYDNFFINHEIPQSDRQYAWVTNSLASGNTDIRYYGHAPVFGQQAGLYSSSVDGWVPFFDYVTASNIRGTTVKTLEQVNTRLNIFTLDPVDNVPGDPSVLGASLTASALTEYINSDLLTKLGIETEINTTASYFNLLMMRRGNAFGWNWNAHRSIDHPILLKHRRSNTLKIEAGRKDKFGSYRLAPVSTRGRSVYTNLDIGGLRPGASPPVVNSRNITAQTTHNNEEIYFNEVELTDLQYPTPIINTTPFDQLVALSRRKQAYSLNWVHYSENVFPSLRNEYLSRSTGRTGYDNKFWRDGAADRVDVGTGSGNSFDITVSQSCWLLDAQEDFLTRTSVPTIPAAGVFISLIINGKAGELQNNYTLIHTGVGATGVTSIKNIRPGALYARKQTLQSPRSVVSPSGVKIAETGSLTSIFLHDIEVYAGEAKWEAGTQAGIIVKSGKTATFEASASTPWFNNYGDFRADLKLVAKDYSIAPEFRISEHIEDYVKFGLSNKNKFDTFEIPGTGIDSTTGSFYKDYSNSEFMSNFLQVKEDTLLDAKEIRLVCNAAIRFNPYNGFYPAQRTLDLVRQFSRSYASSYVANRQGTIVQDMNGHMRPLNQTLFAPGILYNSIRAGMAVDYPIVTDSTKIRKAYYGVSSDTHNWMITTANTASSIVNDGYDGGEYWDYRIPFEAILTPDKYLNNLDFFDMEPHPSASLDVTASWAGQASDNIYSKMADNFFGEVANFFLKDSGLTSLRSEIVSDDLKFQSNSVYGCRLKIKRSSEGARTYELESGSSGDNTAHTKFGGRVYNGTNFSSLGSFPIPQDPRFKSEFKETFTIDSFAPGWGPPIAGRPTGSFAKHPGVTDAQPQDSLAGFNWAYTPPYYNGEAWIDLIFRPVANRTYDLETILAETNGVFWRVDPGISASVGTTHGTQLIPTYSGSNVYTNIGDLIYDGKNVNLNAMQLSASVNYLGVERVQKQSQDKFGQAATSENETAGMRWVIQPKWETPHCSVNDGGPHPITYAAGNLSRPTYGSASVPRRVWHQFGIIPETSEKGIFLEIGDIPKNWLKNHYDVITNNSVYNDSDASGIGPTLFRKMQPLTNIIKFKPENNKVRLGEFADERILKEAVVAIPYILDCVNSSDLKTISGYRSQERKKFFTIPSERVNASKDDAIGSKKGDSLDAAGESIRKLMEKMKGYVFPPQFDWINNKNVSPIVMYVFEFEYKLDSDDLNYVWQNLAPREYKKMTLTSQSVAHTLDNTELLSADNLMNNENLRWMVFKVKQRSQAKYSDLVTPQAGQSSNVFDFGEKQNGYELMHNWPHDYFSIVELIKMDVEVLYKKDEPGGGAGTISGEALNDTLQELVDLV